VSDREGDRIIRQIALAVVTAAVSVSINRRLVQAFERSPLGSPESWLFLVRQVDRDVLPLRVALQHALERELAADPA
jgi:hypothetical protein